MEKHKDDELDQMSNEEYEQTAKRLRRNKQEMQRILEDNPKVGVYQNETHEDWNSFYTFYMNFLKSEIGPRGECAKTVRAQLLQIEDQVNEVLLPFGQNAKTHIRQIYMKHKFFVPCKEYTQLLKIQDANSKFISNLQRLRDPGSPMVRSITEGLRTKHGKEYQVEEELKILQSNYISKMEEAEKEIAGLKEALDKTVAYHEYMKVKILLAPYFKLWNDADSGMGRQNVKTGQAFEDKVKNEMIPYLIYKERSIPNWKYSDKKFQIFFNASWIPKNLGEIDIAFGYKDEVEDRYFIFTLIECKSRLFDLRQAYKQVSLDDQQPPNKGPTLQQLKEAKKIRLQPKKSKTSKDQKPADLKVEDSLNKMISIEQEPVLKQEANSPEKIVINKKFLSTKYGPAELVNDHHFYIITMLPHNDFVLPIESKMKQGIQRYTKNMFIQDIQSQPLYLTLVQRFANVMSPLDWFKNYEKKFAGDESNILVLN